MDSLYKCLLDAAMSNEQELIELRRTLHKFPELSWREHETSHRLQESVKALGLKVNDGVAKTGFYVDIGQNGDAPTLAYRADMDALPIVDHKKTTYASRKDGIGHMCGHDVHSTIAFGIAKLLDEFRPEMNGAARVFWQPAEEVQPSGAPQMIKDGVLDGIEHVFGIHVDPTAPAGVYNFKKGADTASVDTFEFEVIGGSTLHSARPHNGQDTIWIATQICNSLYQLTGRVTDVRDATVLSICKFNAGDALNVIPESVEFGGTVRGTNPEANFTIREKMRELAATYSSMYGAKVNVKINSNLPAVVNDDALVESAREIFTDAVGREGVGESRQSMGAEDFAYYAAERPSLFVRVGSCSSEATSHPLHSSWFDVDESIIAPTSALMAYMMIRQLSKN